MVRGLSLWAPAVGWCLLIYVFSSIPDLNSGLEYDYPLRKAAHMAEYAVLYLLARRALHGTYAPSRVWSLAAGVFAVVYALSDEYHQAFVPGRAGLWSDALVDAAGVALAAWGTAIKVILDKKRAGRHP